MNQAPQAPYRTDYGTMPAAQTTPVSFVLAALGAGLASIYWAGLTALIGLAVTTSAASPAQIIMPIVLIVLYAVRAVQIFKGNGAALNSALWLHGIGAVMGVVQMASGDSTIVILQGIKVAIHVFGGITAFAARRVWIERAVQQGAQF